MNYEILSIINTLQNSLTELNIKEERHQRLYKLIDEINYNINNSQNSRLYQLINKIVIYISYNKELTHHKELMIICKNLLNNVKRVFPLNEKEEIINVAIDEYLEQRISLEEYFQFLIIDDNKKFDGKLTEEELAKLRSSNFSEKEINKIKSYLEKYKESLSGYKDLVGDTLIPNKKMFFFLMDHFGYLMNNDPDEVLSKEGILFRKKINPIVKKVGKKFLPNGQIIENRELLIQNFDNNVSMEENLRIKPDKGIILPDEPVIWVVNHGFKDDTLATILACKRHSYILFGNCAQFYNTVDGILSHLNGIFQCNRKSQSSKKASVDKAIKTINLGADLVVFPEAIWNKSPNKLTIEFWSGFYRIAKETGAKIVPIVHYIKDAAKNENPIHTVIDDPIDITNMTEQEAKEKLTEIFATWQLMMMNAYGRSTREKELEGFTSSHEAWESHLRKLVSQVDRFDSEAEHYADFRSLDRESVRIENVWASIANIIPENEQKDNEICKLVRTLKAEDYQRRI